MCNVEILIISDSHGRVDNIREVAERCKTAKEILFLGDGLRDIDAAWLDSAICVRGNCDMFGADDSPAERILHFGEYTVMMTHGHEYSVKSGFERAAAAAAERGADLLAFGHTHKKTDLYLPAGSEIGGVILKKPLRVFNPGALKDGSFGVLTLRDGIALTSWGEI